MRTMLMIAFTMFSLAGCLDEGSEATARPTRDLEDLAVDSPQEQPTGTPWTPGSEVAEEDPIGVTRCMTNEECQRIDENTEYHYCDVASGVCIRSPWPF